MTKLQKTLEVGSSPHIESGVSVDYIMRHVVYALLPIVVFSIYAFGISALLTVTVATLTCVLTEHWLNKNTCYNTPITDGSAVITGILFALTLPPGLPLWMVVVGGCVGVALGKYLFGGLGANVFNPALVGRAFLQAAFPTAMTTWSPAFSEARFTQLPTSVLAAPFTSPHYDGVSAATPLALAKFEDRFSQASDLALGLSNGSLGETCALVILLSAAYLIARNMMNWRIPAGIFTAVIVWSAIPQVLAPGVYPSPLFMLFSGGLMLGALFMATDMVASPITHTGCFLYGIVIGSMVVVIRFWGGMPEGVMYAILLGNAVSPHIDRLVRPMVFGWRKQKRVP
jgi:electron transport complex protein RnfD